jgi:hypothetical protein
MYAHAGIIEEVDNILYMFSADMFLFLYQGSNPHSEGTRRDVTRPNAVL